MSTKFSFLRLAAAGTSVIALSAAPTFAVSAPSVTSTTYNLLAREGGVGNDAAAYSVSNLKSVEACKKTIENIAITRARNSYPLKINSVSGFCQDNEGSMLQTYQCEPTKSSAKCTITSP